MGYQVSEQDKHLKPGPQMPSKYPNVGPNYNYYGEIPGFIYNPFTDKYKPDPKAVNQWAQQTGQLPEEQSIMDTLLPIAGAAGALQIGKEVGKQLPGLFELGSSPTKAVSETIGALDTANNASNIPMDAIGQNADGSFIYASSPNSGGLLNTGYGNSGGIGGYIGAAVGGYNAFDAAKKGDYTDAMIHGTRGVAAYGTGGLSELAAQGIDAIAGKGTTNKILDPALKYNPVTGPFMFAADALSHKSTKDYQNERWGALSEAAQELRQANHPEGDDGIWDTGKYAGQKWTFEKAQDLAKDDPTHFIGVLGNLETFGDSWLSTPLDKQKAVVTELVNQGLYKSDKGDVLISDKDKAKAKAIYDSIVNGAPMPEDPSQANTKSGLLGLGLNTPAQQQAILNSPVVTQVSAPSSNPVGLFGFSFDPNSKEYNALTKEQKNAYWTARNG